MADIQVIKVNPTNRRVSLSLSHKKAEGISALIQIVVLSLLNTPGKDVLNPGDGAGLPAMIGKNFDPNDVEEIQAEVIERVGKAKDEIIDYQIGLDIDQEERLRDIEVMGVEEGEQIDEVLVNLRVINAAGRINDIVV